MLNRRRQSGFSLVTAIFLIVILSGLGVYIVTVSSIQHTTTGMSVNAMRAYFASRDGTEWGVYQTTSGGTCFASPATFTTDNYSLTVTCASTQHTESSVTYNVYTINSTAVFPGTNSTLVDYVQRVVRLRATDPTAP